MLRTPILLAAAVAATTLIGACAPADSSDGETTAELAPSAALADLDTGWNEILPDGDTICSQGTEFRFFARPGASDRLLVYLQGGGACWNGRTCDLEGDPTYSPTADERDNPAGRPAGIFDLDNPANPVADWSMVFVPYCTGDVHVGDTVATYTAAGEDGSEREFTIHHRGYANVTAVLDWAAERFETPVEILVGGSSAGSIPSPFYAQVLADRYPDARVTSIADASGSYRRDPEGDDPSDSWNMLDVVQRQPGYEGYTAEDIDFRHFTIVAGRRYPDLTLLQFDAVNDAVQQFYVDLASATPEPVRTSIDANLAEIRAEVPGFRAYLAGGPEHTILHRHAFYTYEVDGVLFRDWFAEALAGGDPGDVGCSECERPELHLTDADARVLARAAEILETRGWTAEEGRSCPDEGAPTTLRCAIVEASVEAGDPAAPQSTALLEASFEVRARLGGALPERADPLRVYNAGADRQAIVDLLRMLQERAASHSDE